MIHRPPVAWFALLFLVLLLGTSSAPPAQAGVSEAVLALAGPLAEQFGVPASAVTELLESGISLDSVTKLLLVSQSSESKLDSVTDLYRKSGNSIADAAGKLDVDAEAYSQERVTAAIDQAKQEAQTAAADKAAGEASKAVGAAFEGFQRP